jgi:hypothetical protein
MNYQGTEKSGSFLVSNCVDMGKKEGGAMNSLKQTPVTSTAKVYCPMCTHTVDATVEHHPKHIYVKPGQKCPRCSGSLDAGYIMHLERAA